MLNDVFILTQIKEGNIKAFETLFRQYYTPLRLYAASITGEPDVAEEIVEELFYVFWKDREKLEIFHSVKNYLYRSVRNRSIQYCEHQDVKSRLGQMELLAQGLAEGGVSRRGLPPEFDARGIHGTPPCDSKLYHSNLK